MFSANDQLIECVPNFSEGRDMKIIDAIANAIKNVKDVKLMHVDSGYDANRTVYTFAGKPEAVSEAAYKAVEKANDLVDMTRHKGEHPRMGACDVCPLIPLRHVSMSQVVDLSKKLGKRIGNMGIPVYLYESSASSTARKDLTYLRKGEYEEIKNKILLEEWKPDFGPRVFNLKFGMMALGARNFLLAYNINLKTKDIAIAKKIAQQIRAIREKNDGSHENKLFHHVKAMGWFMEEFDCVQISMNITDINTSPLIEVFTAVKRMAEEINTETNGSELIGLIPRKAFFPGRDDIPYHEIENAVKLLGLDAIKPFHIKERVIEYNLGID